MNLSRLFAPDEGRDGLRTLAGLLLGLGFFMAFARKSGGLGGGWSDWALFITLLIITVFLYALGLVGRLITPKTCSCTVVSEMRMDPPPISCPFQTMS